MTYHFCPKCGHAYSKGDRAQFKKNNGALRCRSCSFVFYDNPKPTASAIIVNEAGRCMIVKRAIEPCLGMWDLPGGFVNYGEDPKKTVARELREELRISTTTARLIGVFHNFYQNKGRKEETYSILNLIYLIKKPKGKLEPRDDINDYRFVSPKQLPRNMAFPEQKKFIEDFFLTKRGH
ncbi:MAG: NUDIX domain-containing protein [Patescibacteria group bacterium]